MRKVKIVYVTAFVNHGITFGSRFSSCPLVSAGISMQYPWPGPRPGVFLRFIANVISILPPGHCEYRPLSLLPGRLGTPQPITLISDAERRYAPLFRPASFLRRRLSYASGITFPMLEFRHRSTCLLIVWTSGKSRNGPECQPPLSPAPSTGFPPSTPPWPSECGA